MTREALIYPSFRRMPEEWYMDVPFTDLRMESMLLISLDSRFRGNDDYEINQIFPSLGCRP